MVGLGTKFINESEFSLKPTQELSAERKNMSVWLKDRIWDINKWSSVEGGRTLRAAKATSVSFEGHVPSPHFRNVRLSGCLPPKKRKMWKFKLGVVRNRQHGLLTYLERFLSPLTIAEKSTITERVMCCISSRNRSPWTGRQSAKPWTQQVSQQWWRPTMAANLLPCWAKTAIWYGIHHQGCLSAGLAYS